jgi:hypothetical protein
MNRKVILAGILVCLFLISMIALPAYAKPDNKVSVTISGFSIKAPQADLRLIGDGTITISKTYEDGIMSLTYTLGTKVYYVKAYIGGIIVFNYKTIQGNALFKFQMDFYAKKLSVTVDNPVVGTLEGITVAKFTARMEPGIFTGTGMQVGGHGTGIMEGVTTKCEGTYYPFTIPGTSIVTQGTSYSGVAIVKD